LPPDVSTLRGENGHGVLRQSISAERGLAAPNRKQDVSGDAKLLLDAGECARVLGGELFRLCGKVSDRGLLDVVGRRLHELGLPARRRAFPAGKIKIGQREIGLERARRRVERRPRNTERFRLGPELLQPLLKTWIGCPRACERGDPHTYEDCRIATKSTHDRFPLRAKARLDPLPRCGCNDSSRPSVNKNAKSAQDMEPPMLQVPLEIAFHNIESSDWAEQQIRARVADLEKLYDRLVSCRVRIDQRAKDLTGTIPPVVHIELGIPGRGDLVVSHEPEHLLRKYQHPDLHKAINEAFRIAERRLLDLKEQRDGRTKAGDHDTENQSLGQIAEVTPEEDFGFLLTKE